MLGALTLVYFSSHSILKAFKECVYTGALHLHGSNTNDDTGGLLFLLRDRESMRLNL